MHRSYRSVKTEFDLRPFTGTSKTTPQNRYLLLLQYVSTGVGDLAIAELARVEHVFLTHFHLDHIACLPLMVDTVGDMRNKPLTVYATEATLEILRAHIFNWEIGRA